MHEPGHHAWSTTAMQLEKHFMLRISITKSLVAGCDIFNRHSIRVKNLVESLSAFRGLHPFAQVSMDIIGPFEKTSSDNLYTLVIVNHNTHHVAAVALPDTTAEMIGVVLVKELFYRFGLPEILGSDKAWYWITEMLKTAYERLQIFKKTWSPYHPQTSGLVERAKSTLMRMLKKMLNQKEDWDVLLDEVTFFCGTTPNEKCSKGFLRLSFCMDLHLDF